MNTMQGYFARISTAAATYDLAALQTAYTQLDGYMATMPLVVDVFLDECGRSYPSGQVSALRSGMTEVESLWRDVRSVCRSDLAPLGFDC